MVNLENDIDSLTNFKRKTYFGPANHFSLIDRAYPQDQNILASIHQGFA